MGKIEEILRSESRPKERQKELADSLCSGKIKPKEFINFFKSAGDVDKGSCADAMKRVSAQKPAVLAPYIGVLVEYINYRAPRVKWGVSEAVGNLAGKYPDRAAGAVPSLLLNAVESKVNTTVVRWCAAYALSEIAKHCKKARKELVPEIMRIAENETNTGVKNVYLKALKIIGK